MKKLLIVVDMQNDFVDGALGTQEAVKIVPAVRERIEEYREQGHEIVFTMDTHYDNYLETLEGKGLPVKHCIKETAGWQICGPLREYEGKRYEKPAFGCTELVEHIRKKVYDSIELAGLCTDICVISNALLLKSFFPGTPIQVKASCCAGVTPESHNNALNAMRMCQIEILK